MEMPTYIFIKKAVTQTLWKWVRYPITCDVTINCTLLKLLFISLVNKECFLRCRGFLVIMNKKELKEISSYTTNYILSALFRQNSSVLQIIIRNRCCLTEGFYKTRGENMECWFMYKFNDSIVQIRNSFYYHATRYPCENDRLRVIFYIRFIFH